MEGEVVELRHLSYSKFASHQRGHQVSITVVPNYEVWFAFHAF